MRTVIFDLDGTLADTSADLIAAANHCFCGLGLGDLLDPKADKLTAFQGGRAMLRLGFSRVQGFGHEEVKRQYPVLLEAYAENIDNETQLYPGAVEAIEALRSQNFVVGICTNKPEGLAETLLQRLHVRNLFSSLIGVDTLRTRKPDAAPYRAAVERAGGKVEKSFLLGDTKTDLKTAHAAGVPSVLVAFGPEGHGIAKLKPDALLDSYSDLPDLAQSLLGPAVTSV